MIKLFKLVLLVAVSLLNAAWAADLATFTVTHSNQAPKLVFEGVVEAIKTSQIAPQVSGSVTALPVKAGDNVKAGQLLVRIDTRIAAQQAMTNQAQVGAAKAQLSAAHQEYVRKKRLYEKQYISQAALERAESDYKTAEAQTKAQLAQTGLSNVQTGLHTINAPYAGVVAEVMTELGDMAMPGKPLLAIYDPSLLRVVINVPQSQVDKIKQEASIKVLISGANEAERSLSGTQVSVLPTADSVSNMVKVRVTLPQNTVSIKPGMFARAEVPVSGTTTQGQLYVPKKSVVKRSELTAVYVVDSKGHPQLRQVRLGREQGENIEIFAGLQAGENVATDPIAVSNLK